MRFEAAFPGAEAVFIAGDFNGWDPQARRMKRVRAGQDDFVAVVDLPAGTHQFKYVVDGEWLCCPSSPCVKNEHGTDNSVVEVAS